MKIELEISKQRIADMMVGAIEGGSAHWCAGVYLKTRMPMSAKAQTGPWYSRPAVYESEFVIEVHESDDTREEGVAVHSLTRPSFQRGLRLMAKYGGQHFGDMMAETDDATTADVFLQFVALGEIRYG